MTDPDNVLKYVEEKFGVDAQLVDRYARVVDGYAVTYKQLAFPSRFGILVPNLLIDTLDITEKGFCVFTWRNDPYTSRNLEKLLYLYPTVAKKSSKKGFTNTFKISGISEFVPVGDLHVRKKRIPEFLRALNIKDKGDEVMYLKDLDDLLLREYNVKLLADFSEYEPKLIESVVDSGVTLDKLLVYFQVGEYKLGVPYKYDPATNEYKQTLPKVLLENPKILDKIKDVPNSLESEQVKDLASEDLVKIPSEYAYIFLAASHMISDSLWISWHEVPWRYEISRKFREFLDTFGGLINVYEISFPLEILIYKEKAIESLIEKSDHLRKFKDPSRYELFDKADVLFNIHIPRDIYIKLKDEDLSKYKSRIPSTTEYFIAKSLIDTLHKK